MNNIPNVEELYFKKIWKLRQNPFKSMSAEDISNEDILDVFIFNDDLYSDVFDINNSIVRGQKGTGKTMLLRAIYNLYSYKAVVDISEGKKVSCIPVFINVSLFNQIQDQNEIYRRIILKIIEELINFNSYLNDIKFNENWFDKFSNWIKKLFKDNKELQDEYASLSSRVIKEIFTEKGYLNSDISANISRITLEMENQYNNEITHDKFIGVENIKKIYNKFLSSFTDNILIIFDEISSLDAQFFERKEGNESLYIKLINQLRTTQNIYYKIAIYPFHYSDQLEESRYGNSINLDLNVYNPDHMPFNRRLIKKTIESYVKTYRLDETLYNNLSSYIELSKISDNSYVGAEEGNDLNTCGDAIEQIVFGSRGIFRRIMSICSDAFKMVAQQYEQGIELVITKQIIVDVLSNYGKELYSKFTPIEQQELSTIAKVCRKRTRSRFSYPYGTNYLRKFLEKGIQDNIIYLLEEGRGRAPSIFEFDYAFCIYAQLPTHLLRHIERTANSRSLTNGNFLIKRAKIDGEELVNTDKYYGRIEKVIESRGFGFIECSELSSEKIFFHRTQISDKNFKASLEKKEVEFKIRDGRKGKEAYEVNLLK